MLVFFVWHFLASFVGVPGTFLEWVGHELVFLVCLALVVLVISLAVAGLLRTRSLMKNRYHPAAKNYRYQTKTHRCCYPTPILERYWFVFSFHIISCLFTILSLCPFCFQVIAFLSSAIFIQFFAPVTFLLPAFGHFWESITVFFAFQQSTINCLNPKTSRG